MNLLKQWVRPPIHNCLRNKNSRKEKWCKCNQLPPFTRAIALKFYIKNLSASLDQTLKRIDPVEDFVPNTINSIIDYNNGGRVRVEPHEDLNFIEYTVSF